MPETTNQGWCLPTAKKYRNWSKAKLQEEVQSPALSGYLVDDAKYRVNENTLAIYQFQKQPLLNKYKSAIFDLQKGIVLCTSSSRSLINSFTQNNLLGGLEFQREFANWLNQRSHYVIATGKRAYFSMHGYTTGDTDWVALHHMANFRSLGKSTIAFNTVTCRGLTYTFTFTDCTRYISTQVYSSLYYNHAMYKLGSNHLEYSLGWQVRRTQGKSLLDKRAYFHPHPTLNTSSLKDIYQAVLDKSHARYGQCLAKLLEQPLIQDDHHTVYLSSRRPNTLF
ncbi:hypothetical protein [Lactobacillus sp. ESL0677]|uniref:hypothetical protein n=1 Tax=Lactobacillus sp. ESL0677 TaxID=2983208 RepID=UPI0023F61A0E|nr:hypothetical protein [Lactobacillus sp. ESL0677]WEV36838.1 hypothetical protein OZX76_08885 [Lactobacillus sp. ESL0677]